MRALKSGGEMTSPPPVSREVHIKTVRSTATGVGLVFEQEEEWTYPFMFYFAKPLMINTSVLSVCVLFVDT